MGVKRNSDPTSDPPCELRPKGVLSFVAAFASWKQPLASVGFDQWSIDLDIEAQELGCILGKDMLGRFAILSVLCGAMSC